LFVGAMSHLTDDEDREWLARLGAWLLIPICVWAVVSALVFYGPPLVVSYTSVAVTAASTAGVSGLVTLVTGFSSKTASAGGTRQKGDATPSTLDLVVLVAAPVFVALLAVGLAIATDAALVWVWTELGDAATWAVPAWTDAVWLHRHWAIVVDAPS